MDTVLGRLRAGSKTRKNISPGPSKEDILNAIDTFDKNGSGSEDNNNLVRKNSRESCDERYDVEDGESPSASYSHSYRYIESPVQTDWMWTVIKEGSKYSAEWERLFNTPGYMVKLKKHGIEGRLRSSRFRSVVWKVYLEALPADMDRWLTKCREWRNKYEVLKNQLIVNPRKAVDRVDITINNPLSQDDESPWNQFFQDNELRLTIKQDVIRTYPKIEFFQSNQLRNLMVDILFIYAKVNPDLSYRQLEFFKSDELQDMMVNVLFCYSRSHPSISYKQGMHELLAPLIFVLHCDHQAFLHASEIETLHYMAINDRDIVKEIMSPTHLEHDAYAMFCQVMETVEPWYTTKENFHCKGREYVVAQPFSRPQDLNPSSVIVTKLTRIQDYLLKKFDPELHQHLERLDIAPQIYGIRWVRLLFGREFPMQDLLVLWDAIFADGIGFDLVDYVFVSMLLYIRNLLLASDYAALLTCLMKYVPVGDIHYFIEKALYLREPNQYPRPPNYTYQNVNTAAAKARSSRAYQSHNRQGHSRQGGFSSFSRKFNRPKTLMFSSKNLPKSSSEPMNLQTDISPASPVVVDTKRGSTASLSQLEDQMFRHTPSSSSLARLEVMNRSTQSTPAARSPVGFSGDDASTHSSPTKYSTMPGRSKIKAKKITRNEQDLQQQVCRLQGQLNDKSTMCNYCSSKLDIHIDRLQGEIMKLELDADDEVMLALAGIKQVRDVLNGTLRFSQNLLDEDEIAISDNYYKDEPITSPESDLAGSMSGSMTGTLDHHRGPRHSGKGKRQKLFYMSSEDNSEAAESPESFNGVSHPQGKELELDNFLRKRRSSRDSASGGPQMMTESIVSDSGSQSSNTAQTQSAASDVFDVSPNPLYNLNVSDTMDSAVTDSV